MEGHGKVLKCFQWRWVGTLQRPHCHHPRRRNSTSGRKHRGSVSFDFTDPVSNFFLTILDHCHQEERRSADKRMSSYIRWAPVQCAAVRNRLCVFQGFVIPRLHFQPHIWVLLILAAEGRAMRRPSPRGITTVWMRTQRGGTITWTWLVSRTTPPDLKASVWYHY